MHPRRSGRALPTPRFDEAAALPKHEVEEIVRTRDRFEMRRPGYREWLDRNGAGSE
jgi:hypothetical protein